MEITAAYYTDRGNIKEINQDSLSVKVVNSPRGKIVFAMVCDGMGGLEQGELASKEVVVAFNNWFATQFANMVAEDSFTEEYIWEQWQELIEVLNSRMGEYAKHNGIMMGTTVSALLIYAGEYYICHVGDSRIYCIDNQLHQITRDQTLVAQEVAMGRLTADEAKVDSRRSILLQCVGASEVIEPQFEKGILNKETTFILSSDGFVHTITDEEMYREFNPLVMHNKEQITNTCMKLSKMAMERGERDNITVIAIAVKKIDE